MSFKEEIASEVDREWNVADLDWIMCGVFHRSWSLRLFNVS